MRTSLAQMAPVSVSGNSGSEKTMRSLRLSGEIAVMPRDQKEGEIRGAENMSKYILDASVISKGESNMDFSALDEKLGKGVTEALSTMIREAVVQGIAAVLPEIVKTVGFSPKSGSDCVKLSNTAPVVTPPSDTLKRIKFSNTSLVVTLLSDPLKEILDANLSICLGDEPVTKKSTWRCKGRKRGLPVSVVKCLDLLFRPTKEIKFFDKELTIAAYIFGNNLDTEEVLVPNDHCSGTCKTLLTIMPRKPIIGDVVNDFTRMRLAMDLVNDFNNSKRDIIVELSVIDWNKKMQQFVMQT
ncbi:hypothetical protein HN51_015745 [Arachis hypogaea]